MSKLTPIATHKIWLGDIVVIEDNYTARPMDYVKDSNRIWYVALSACQPGDKAKISRSYNYATNT